MTDSTEDARKKELSRLARMLSYHTPGTLIDDFLEGNWRGSELVNTFDSYALVGEEISSRTVIDIIERTELSRMELGEIRQIARNAYDALQGRPSIGYKSRIDPKIAEQYDLIYRHVNNKLERIKD